MPSLSVTGQSDRKSQSYMSRQTAIRIGLDALNAVGTTHICQVCISNGGSCCNGCRHLANGAGCQLRNTSCTAWLCGFLKYLLYETGLLQEWNDFWDQVPGLDYRGDYTPEHFFIERSLNVNHVYDIGKLSEALAADLEEISREHIAIGFIFTLQNKLDRIIDRLEDSKHDPEVQNRIRRNLNALSSPFQRFHILLRSYKQKPTQ